MIKAANIPDKVEIKNVVFIVASLVTICILHYVRINVKQNLTKSYKKDKLCKTMIKNTANPAVIVYTTQSYILS